MDRRQPEQAARDLVEQLHPDAMQAWLGGSAHTGATTTSSDLDITVLHSGPAVYRQSLTFDQWPVELFVHTETSIRYFVERDLQRRKPTMARLVAESTPLLQQDHGTAIHAYCTRTLDQGPPPATPADLDLARYTITDLLDDLAGGGADTTLSAVVVSLWRETAELILATHNHWTGSGKWLIRELEDLDQQLHSTHATALDGALRTAVAGDPADLIQLAERALTEAGGRLRDGYFRAAPIGDSGPGH